MPNQYEIMALQIKKSRIIRINLQNMEEQSFEFNFIRHRTTIEMWLFPESHLICIKEATEEYPPNQMRLTYFNAINFDGKQLINYEIDYTTALYKGKTHFYKIFKGNQKSMVIFANTR